ncbi:hypothetical protein [Streptococcus pneumoniae]|uniref:hypothetical protein n=1 Tax=Streptococcus pneumoniae TaxID=1313 RepID=UPI00067D3CE5|nr:hypothetical protein [Streptococcus pneumoniae]
MKIKEQTRRLTAGCSKHCFEPVDKTDEAAQNTVLRLWIELMWFEEIFEESYLIKFVNIMSLL